MKKESERTAYSPEKSGRQQPSLHDLYFTEDIDIEEELRLIETDPRLKDVTGDPGTLDKIKAEWAKMNMDVEMSEELSDITDVVSKEELSHLSPEARELLELGMKVKAEECEDEPKVRVIRKRSKRVLFAVAAVIVLSMAASTTGVTSLYKYIQVEEKGEEDQFRFVDSETDMVWAEVNEVEIYQEVDKFFGAPVVKLYGHLAGLEFIRFLLHEDDMSADIVYEYEGNRIYYSIQSNYNQLSQMATAEENIIVDWVESELEAEILVQKSATAESDYYNYVLSFAYNNLYYKISLIQVPEDVYVIALKYLYF